MLLEKSEINTNFPRLTHNLPFQTSANEVANAITFFQNKLFLAIRAKHFMATDEKICKVIHIVVALHKVRSYLSNRLRAIFLANAFSFLFSSCE